MSDHSAWTQHVTKPSKRCAFVSSPKAKYVDDRSDRSRDTRDRYVADRTRAMAPEHMASSDLQIRNKLHDIFFRDRTARPRLYNETLRSPLTCRRSGTGSERYRPERCNTATYFLSVTP